MSSDPPKAQYGIRLTPAQPIQDCAPGIAANDILWPLADAGSQGTMPRAAVADARRLAVADGCRSGPRMRALVADWSFEVPDRSAIDPGIAPLSAPATGVKQGPERHSTLGALLRFLAELRTRAADRRCLCVLDDHILTDIGFTRDEANRPVWRPFGRF